ncbi:MAG: FHA domain-containing protein [Planctomycetota bacterium]
MKVELVVLQGGLEGKRIAMTMPLFRIGRGETCHLRPNSERVSREHAEFIFEQNLLQVRDLGSRNGTLVNGKPIEATTTLAQGDQVTVGPLNFVIAFDGNTAPVGKPVAAPAVAPVAAQPEKSKATPADDIAAWLMSDEKKPAATEAPSSLYSGETITTSAFRVKQNEIPESSGISEAARMDDQGFERQSAETSADSGQPEDSVEEFVDESNPFHQKKPAAAPVASASAEAKKEMYKDTAEAATAILRKLMDRKKDDDD